MKSIFPTTAFSICLILSGLHAADAVRIKTSVDNLAAQAIANNPEIDFLEGEIAAAKGGRRTAGQLSIPTTSVQGAPKRIGFDGAGSDNGVAWSLSVAQTFEWPGRLALRKAIADQQIDLANLGLDEFRAALAARLRTLAFRYQAAERNEEAALAAA